MLKTEIRLLVVSLEIRVIKGRLFSGAIRQRRDGIYLHSALLLGHPAAPAHASKQIRSGRRRCAAARRRCARGSILAPAIGGLAGISYCFVCYSCFVGPVFFHENALLFLLI